MVRNILAVFAGIIVGSICIWGVETLNHFLHPFPKGTRPDNMGDLRNYVETLPFLGKFMVIVGYALGAVVSGFIATKVSKTEKPNLAIICGIIFLCFTLYNMSVLPTPIWFWILGVLVWILVLAGYKLALSKK
ncbi:hypothetical protein [Chryseobacterium terrae]|uniref:DUF4345 domain-containing protein n=1 Tax=Chryseobacterium terrae TaxID=3163299 RepID=A0ABW8Y1F9_9FLAO